METAHLRSIAAALRNAVSIHAHDPHQRPSLQHRLLKMIRGDPYLKVVQSDKNAGLVVMPLAAYNDISLAHGHIRNILRISLVDLYIV